MPRIAPSRASKLSRAPVSSDLRALGPVSRRPAYAGVAEVSIYVSGASQGRGVGTRLLSALVSASEDAGIWSLQAGIFEINIPSIALHKRCGFRIVGIRERIGQLHGAWHNVVLMERRSPRVGAAVQKLGELGRGLVRRARRGAPCARGRGGSARPGASAAAGRLASQSFGYIEIDVKPGSVSSSLTRTRPLPRSRKKSTRAMPERPQSSKTSTASRRTSSATAGDDVGRNQELRLVVAVLVVVVVELVPRDDLADDRGLRLVVAEHGALELPGVDAFLGERSVVVAPGEVQGGVDVLPPLDLADADRGAAAGRLDEDGQREAQRLENALHAFPSSQVSRSRRERATELGVGMSASRRSALKTSLSMPTAEPVTPAPT